MLLAIDVGNTHVVIGLMEDDAVLGSGRFHTDRDYTEEEYGMLIDSYLRRHKYDPEQVQGAILSSVVPQLTPVFTRAIGMVCDCLPMVIGPGIKTGLDIRIDNPAQLGSDLVVNAVAAIAKYPLPIIIFDMGTATTASVIDEQGHYRGGMIIPGLRLSVNALSARAAQLPLNIGLEAPEQVIGTNTIASMRSGALYGHAAALDGIIDRIAEELGFPVEAVTVIGTGGLMQAVYPLCRREIIFEPELMLYGLAQIYRKNLRG
ncbi:MAG: type III pantothenate kinase [Clostridiaceae bacterium]|nr:type III pantothenate kinase [Clostridiaceae bacterium]